MSNDKGDLDVDALVEEHDSPEEVWDTLMADAPELPERFQHMDREELLDLDIRETTEDEARKIAEWIIHQRQASGLYTKAKERMEDE